MMQGFPLTDSSGDERVGCKCGGKAHPEGVRAFVLFPRNFGVRGWYMCSRDAIVDSDVAGKYTQDAKTGIHFSFLSYFTGVS
jgi:hypothetical protein